VKVYQVLLIYQYFSLSVALSFSTPVFTAREHGPCVPASSVFTAHVQGRWTRVVCTGL